MTTCLSTSARVEVRQPSVAGSFYPADRSLLSELVDELLAEADRLGEATDQLDQDLLGLLVPHAGLVYSGVVAATGWRLVGTVRRNTQVTVVILGTNHGAGWLDGVAAWDAGAWRTPLGDLRIDIELVRAVLDLGPPFMVDRPSHWGEHSIEVQLPLLGSVAPWARIVPLSVAAGAGDEAIAAGRRLGTLLAQRRAAGERVILAISSDMAHYPASSECARVTAELLPSILRLDPGGLAARERAIAERGTPGLVCGMCGIQPAVLGLAALHALGATRGRRLAEATSADAGGPSDSTVGYLAAAFSA